MYVRPDRWPLLARPLAGSAITWQHADHGYRLGQPIGQVLGDGFRVPELLPGWTALEGIVLVKCLDAEGHPSWGSAIPKV